MHQTLVIEPLESRIAPAAFVTYTDLDGDRVKITASTGPLDLADLTLSGGGIGQLQTLDLTDAGFQRANITFTVTKAPLGDGLADVGRINATGVDLGIVTVKGDLGVIDAGDANPTTTALKVLNVRSMGLHGLASQPGAGDLRSDIIGRLGALNVAGDLQAARIEVTAGGIGSVTIGGSLRGGAGDESGVIFSDTDIGPVKIGRDLVGGSGSYSGVVNSGSNPSGPRGDLASIKIGGSILGGSGDHSGLVRSGVYSGLFRNVGDMGPVQIGGDVVGGRGSGGAIISHGTLSTVTIGGSLIGDTTDSGWILSAGAMGFVKIGGDLVGGRGEQSGYIHSLAGGIAGVTIRGSLIGGSNFPAGRIDSTGDMGPVQIGGDVIGGSDRAAGSIRSTGLLSSVTIGGSLIAGSGDSSGSISAGSDIGFVKIARNVSGDAGLSGSISSGGRLDALTIGGLLRGGQGEGSGSIEATTGFGPIKIGGDLIGGKGLESGRIFTHGNLATLTIGGSLLGGSGDRTGQINAEGAMGPLKIGGDLRGGSIAGNAPQLDSSGFVQAKRIASVWIGGSIISGFDTSTDGGLIKNGSIRAADDIGPITVKGSLIGHPDPADSGNDSPVIISARGQAAPGAATDVAIASLTVGGRVEFARILGGFAIDDSDTAGSNGNAQIGAVKVGGHWIASSLTAGVQDGGAAGFGDAGDTVINNPADAIVARIASITIAGLVIGTADSATDHFGFTAQQIGSFKSLGYIAPLHAGPPPGVPDVIALSPLTGEVTIREV